MLDFERARYDMVEFQLKRRGIHNARVLSAMLKVERHRFVPEGLIYYSYDDGPLSIGLEQTISQPYMVASMTELLDVKEGHRVLEIGTGSGYQAAVLAELAKEVYTVERLSELSCRAKDILSSCGYQNIKYAVGDGTKGWPEEAPFDGIIVTAAAPKVPQSLIKQLKIGGNILIPIGDRFSQDLIKITKTEKGTVEQTLFGCRFVSLIGEEAFS